MLTINQTDELSSASALEVAKEYYGFQTGPVLVVVADTNLLALSNGWHRISSSYAYMFTGEALIKPTPVELAENFKAV